jgi:hypothetical protein
MDFNFQYGAVGKEGIPVVHQAAAEKISETGFLTFRVNFAGTPAFTIACKEIPNSTTLQWNQILAPGEEKQQDDFIGAVGKGIENDILYGGNKKNQY